LNNQSIIVISSNVKNRLSITKGLIELGVTMFGSNSILEAKYYLEDKDIKVTHIFIDLTTSNKYSNQELFEFNNYVLSNSSKIKIFGIINDSKQAFLIFHDNLFLPYSFEKLVKILDDWKDKSPLSLKNIDETNIKNSPSSHSKVDLNKFKSEIRILIAEDNPSKYHDCK
jgi:hypothetical protein